MLEAALAQFWQSNPGTTVHLSHKEAVTETTPGELKATHVMGARDLDDARAHKGVIETQSMETYLAAIAAWDAYQAAAKQAEADGKEPPQAPAPVVLSQRGADVVTVKEPAEVTLFLPVPGSTEHIAVRGPLESIAAQAGVLLMALRHTNGDLRAALSLIQLVPGAPR
jgi:hypothetical protein